VHLRLRTQIYILIGDPDLATPEKRIRIRNPGYKEGESCSQLGSSHAAVLIYLANPPIFPLGSLCIRKFHGTMTKKEDDPR